jgi:hypothetical protein
MCNSNSDYSTVWVQNVQSALQFALDSSVESHYHQEPQLQFQQRIQQYDLKFHRDKRWSNISIEFHDFQ